MRSFVTVVTNRLLRLGGNLVTGYNLVTKQAILNVKHGYKRSYGFPYCITFPSPPFRGGEGYNTGGYNRLQINFLGYFFRLG